MLADLHDAANTVEFYEGARFHAQRYRSMARDSRTLEKLWRKKG